LNPRPPGYEPGELPDCSTPRRTPSLAAAHSCEQWLTELQAPRRSGRPAAAPSSRVGGGDAQGVAVGSRAAPIMTRASHFVGRHALISGGSTGIGAAAARSLASRGAGVTLIARREDVLGRAAAEISGEHPGVRVRTLPLDVTDERAVAHLIARELAEQPADLLVNSAGIVHAGRFLETEPERFRALMETNYFGTLWMVRAVVPHFRERGRGHVVNVSSVAALEGVYAYSAYCASKFAVYGLSQSLRAELRPAGIGVSVVLPPNTDTPMLEAERALIPSELRPAYDSFRVLSATQVAEALVKGIDGGRFEIFPGIDNRLTARLHRLSPAPLRAYLDWRVRRELARRSQGGKPPSWFS
jgi:3-dehydrosphinganine reductase